MFKNLCNEYKVTGESLTIPDGQRLEMYVEPTLESDLSNGSINVLNGQTLTVNNGGNIYFYPFVLKKKRFNVFNLKYGATLNLNGNWSGLDIQGKLETYNITFRVGGDLKKIKVNGEVRDGFWEGLAPGDTLFVNHAFETQGEEVTISSFDSTTGIITLVNNLTYGSTDLNNQYTTGGFFFPEDVSLSDYQQYGQFWIYDNHRCFFIYSIPAPQVTPPAVSVNLTDFKIYGFARQMMLSVANGTVKYYGSECRHERNEIGVNFYSSGTANYQTYDWTECDNLYFVDCGTMAGGSISAITAGDILGSGAYIHPNILMRGGNPLDPSDVTTGILRLHNNTGTAFRQYSSGGDNPIILGDPEYYSRFGLIDCLDNIEADIRTSNIIPTIITELRNSTQINLHYETTINGGTIREGYINPTESNNQGDFVTNVILNNMTINPTTNLDIGGNVQMNNCEIHVGVADVESSHVFSIVAENPNLELINCELIPDPAISRYVPGSAEPASPVLGKAIIFVGNIADDNEVLNLGYFENVSIRDNDFYCGYLVQEDDSFNSYKHRLRKIEIIDSDLRVSRLSNYTHLRENFTNQIEISNSRVNSPRMIQSTSERPFLYTPRITSVDKSISAGVIEFDFENEINVIGGGTLHTLFPRLYNGAAKINASMWYNGTIRLNAVGSSFSITNTGNINQTVTVNAGEFIELTASRDILGTLTPASIILATSNGTLTQIKSTLAVLVGLDRRFIEVTNITSDEVATVDTDGSIIGSNTFGMVDNRTGSFDINFTSPVPNGQTVTLNYQYYSVINHKGVWKG